MTIDVHNIDFKNMDFTFVGLEDCKTLFNLIEMVYDPTLFPSANSSYKRNIKFTVEVVGAFPIETSDTAMENDRVVTHAKFHFDRVEVSAATITENNNV